MKRPEKIVTRHYGNGIINAAPSDRGFSHRSNAIFESEYTRSDIADARVAAAYEAAAELACERLADSWSWDDEDFLSCVIADLKRHIIEAGPTQKAKAALEQVRREARAEALREAADLARENWRSWDNATPIECDATACEYISDAISALIDKPTQEKSDA